MCLGFFDRNGYIKNGKKSATAEYFVKVAKENITPDKMRDNIFSLLTPTTKKRTDGIARPNAGVSIIKFVPTAQKGTDRKTRAGMSGRMPSSLQRK